MITKMKLLLCVFPLILTGCAGYDLAGLIGGESTPKSDNLNIAAYRMYGKTITCSEIGNSVSKAYQLKKKGKSKEDIYWEITPEDSTYIRQDIYTILIDVGMAADSESHKLFTEACRKNIETYQSLYDDSSKSLYARVDLIYNFVYNQELKNYRASFSGGLHAPMYRYGNSKNNTEYDFVRNKSRGGMDETSNEINNLIYEQMIEILYKPAYMGESRHPGNIMPSLDSVRREMAPELVLKLVK